VTLNLFREPEFHLGPRPLSKRRRDLARAVPPPALANSQDGTAESRKGMTEVLRSAPLC
jgi:hypothetical protein